MLISLKNKKKMTHAVQKGGGSPRPMVLGPPGKHKLGYMKGNVLVLTVARIAKRLRKFLALSTAWHC